MLNQMNPYMNNMLPAQQILQANGKQSIDNLRMAPNSSVLIADSTAPIVWRCVSDGLGNVSAEAFDITPHKSQEQIEKDNLVTTIQNLELRLKSLEESYESTIKQHTESDDTERTANVKANARNKKSPSDVKSDDGE